MAKKILGLDLGTTSIGWAYVHEAQDKSETSKIINAGVRVLPLTTDERTDFEKGKATSINAARTLARGARRNLDRYQLRRNNLLEILTEKGFIDSNFRYAETEKNSTFSSYKLRARASHEKISLEELAKVLLMINKKRGYKSSRKAKTTEEGQAINGMEVAKRLYDEKITPGQLVHKLLAEGKKYMPEFYRSDLKNEFELIWNFQNSFHPNILNEELKLEIDGKGITATKAIFYNKFKTNQKEIKGTRDEVKKEQYQLRSDATQKELTLEELIYVISEINNNLNSSSGYLGAISDRSKELYFNNLTIGEYLYQQLQKNKHTSLKNQVFYRQDYMDEFEVIWETQAKFHTELNKDLKTEIRDVVIFYQRKLKSQKHLISNCEFELHHKACPKSSPVFQEFKIWNVLNNLTVTDTNKNEQIELEIETKQLLFTELNIFGRLSSKEILQRLGYSEKTHELNFKEVEGNNTNRALYDAYLKILEMEGMDNISFKSNSIDEINNAIHICFKNLGINTNILKFDAGIQNFDKQESYELWHLLYSIEDETHLIKALKKFGFNDVHIPFLLNVSLQADYSGLSSKAIRKLIPHLIEGNGYDTACLLAKYGSHSNSLTKEQLENRSLKEKLNLLKKNSLRNPIVEKILNQMVHVVNAVIEHPNMGKPDEIRIELARELKKSSKEREEMTKSINSATREHEVYRKTLQTEVGIKNPTRNDIIRYKLYLELKDNGFHTLYSNTYIPLEKLFSKEFDIEHIIPQAKLFDDSFSNKTIEKRDVNIEKSNLTALDYMKQKRSADELEQYLARVERLFKKEKRTKYGKLMMEGSKIPDGFIDRDLRNTQYIAKKAKEMLEDVVRTVTPTTGMVTDKLREDWDLINVMQELNFSKYEKQKIRLEKKDGSFKERIVDWSKRNDHRHHAMDAITVAFTKHSHIQYLNNLNARGLESAKGKEIYGIEQKEIHRDNNGKLKFNLPMPHFRHEAKEVLENILVSFKAKNKVVTKNKNKIKLGGTDKYLTKIELTPRGQLHKETIYGKKQSYETKLEKVGASFTLDTIEKVANQKERNALKNRLIEFNNDPKLAFTGKNSLEKNPIFIDKQNDIKVPEKVKLVWLMEDYTIRKQIGPELKIDKVVDIAIQHILQKRLAEFNNDPKKAFVELDKNPIWLNQEKGISIKSVKISGVSNAEALHVKKDNLGQIILDKEGKEIPVDFVSTGNNHHVAIYKDEKGNLQEEIVSFYEAVHRVKAGLQVVNKQHEKGWEFCFTMKQNEYFIFSDSEFNANEVDLFDPKFKKEVAKRLYRVQKIGAGDYTFRHHLESLLLDKKELTNLSFKRITKKKDLVSSIKVRINHLGDIVSKGEY